MDLFLELNNYDILTPDGFKSFSGIQFSLKETIILVTNSGKKIECTPDHKVMVETGVFKEVKDLRQGIDMVSTVNGFEYIQTIFHTHKKEEIVADFVEVEDTHTYYTNGILSHNCNILMLDEFAFVPNNLADEFFTSVYPVITSGNTTKTFIISTPNGMNHFYKLWEEARTGQNDYKTIDVHWSRVPGRDQKWADTTRRNMGEQKFDQEMEANFLGSQHTLIGSQYIKNMVVKKPISLGTGQFDGLSIYEEPKAGHVYVAVVDSGHGKGLDFSATQVIDITEYPFVQAAVYRNNNISSLIYPTVVEKIARKYNNAEVLVENNDIGEQTGNILHYELEYPNVTWVNEEIGVKTTKKVKSIGCGNLKQIVESSQIIINDVNTIQEFSTFAVKGKSYEAEQGCHDDLVMCLVLFSWFSNTQYFKDLTNQDIRAKIAEGKKEQIENEMSFMFVTTGSEDDDLMDTSSVWSVVD